MAVIKQSDIYDSSNGNPFEDLIELMDNGKINIIRSIKNEPTKQVKCTNCGATKHKYICEYCGT
jgi:hypothetical protein